MNHIRKILIVRRMLLLLCLIYTLVFVHAQKRQWTPYMLNAYLHENMAVWKAHVDSLSNSNRLLSTDDLIYEYGYCGYIVDKDKEAAKPYVKRFKEHIEAAHALPYSKDKETGLPPGHYEMYLSAVYVYELRLHESFHPVKAMSLAKDAVQIAPDDPLTLSYYATCLFYAPKPFGSKAEALKWFDKADTLFKEPQWEYCWVREATKMYIQQCREKLKK